MSHLIQPGRGAGTWACGAPQQGPRPAPAAVREQHVCAGRVFSLDSSNFKLKLCGCSCPHESPQIRPGAGVPLRSTHPPTSASPLPSLMEIPACVSNFSWEQRMVEPRPARLRRAFAGATRGSHFGRVHVSFTAPETGLASKTGRLLHGLLISQQWGSSE